MYYIAIYNFAGSTPHQLSFNVGELLRVEEETQGWYRGAVVTDQGENKTGLFPANYVKLKTESPVTADWAINEISQVLREWLILMKKQLKVLLTFLRTYCLLQ